MGSYIILLRQLRSCLSTLEARLLPIFGINKSDHGSLYETLDWNYNPSATDVACREKNDVDSSDQTILGRILGDGFMWAVQTHRRTIEKRLTRKNAVEKHRKAKKNLIMCNVCGHFHEAHTICGNCYAKVRTETKALQDAVATEWHMDPVDKEVVVLYKNDEKNQKEFWKGKRIVEVDRERPLWFHENLQTRSNAPETPKDRLPQVKTILSRVK